MSGDFDALVIGGGPAGAALAHLLARGGRSALVVEREAQPAHKVCGEFISAEAAFYMRDIGVDVRRLGAAPIDSVRLCASHRTAASRLPFPAFSLSRRVLDAAILEAAMNAGAVVRRVRATRLVNQGGVWRAQLADGAVVSARAAFLATGKHDLPNWKRPAGIQPDFIGFKAHWRLEAAQGAELAGHVELIPFSGGYAGLQRIETGDANLCLVVRQSAFAALGGRWDALVCALRSASPQLDRRLAGATQCWRRPQSIWPIPYGHLCTASDGAWRLGDQAAVVPSFSGDGIAIALHSANLAAQYYLSGKPSGEFQTRLASDLAAQIRRATWLSRVLVHPFGQAAAAATFAFAPGLLAVVARATRVPGGALRRARDPFATAIAP
ncbi:MAG TPA: FAD-dependent monooxygenase [Beijerinckiaceae bacterium]|nr:FAD-dependent monooxygenase [Beijerinckiaceae bacterium]